MIKALVNQLTPFLFLRFSGTCHLSGAYSLFYCKLALFILAVVEHKPGMSDL